MSRNITEVWDYRLSLGQPILYRGGLPHPTPDEEGNLTETEYPYDTGTWVVVVMSQDEAGTILEYYDTGVPVEDGDLHDGEGIDACYTFLREVREKYSRADIEKLKPVVAELRKAQAELQALQAV